MSASTSTSSSSLRQNFELLPLIAQLLTILQTPSDHGDKLAAKVNELREQIARCYRILDELEGGELGEKEQQEQYDEQVKKLEYLSELVKQCQAMPILQGGGGAASAVKEEEKEGDTSMADAS